MRAAGSSAENAFSARHSDRRWKKQTFGHDPNGSDHDLIVAAEPPETRGKENPPATGLVVLRRVLFQPKAPASGTVGAKKQPAQQYQGNAMAIVLYKLV
ncbi:MAG: hypothetical protein EKK52_03250 [Burkholderiales bacterium]|nr:MAG: hypothetical protein EKK52_03250 [Burkholderiales bacterium]